MKELYKEYWNLFSKAEEIAEKYDILQSKIAGIKRDIEEFKVTLPLVGGFSTGKSSLINAALGRELLTTDITPETAVPTEIFYGKDNVRYISETSEENSSLDNFYSRKLSAEKVDLAVISIEDEFLKEISSVKIVDMPGFDSGYEMHNRAISDYLPKSLAYIITMSADEGTLKESVLNFLKELKLSRMPVYAVITKADKVRADELDEIKEYLRETIENILEVDNIRIEITSADDEECEGFKDILRDVQSRSDDIFKRHFSATLYSVLMEIRGYISSLVSKKDYSAEELQTEINELETNIDTLKNEVNSEKEDFDRQCERSIDEIKNRVISDIRSNSDALENMLVQGNDISGRINGIVRNSVTVSIKQVFEPKIRQFTDNVSDIISQKISDVDTSAPVLSSEIKSENEQMRNSLQGLVTPVSTAVTSVAGSLAGTAVAPVLGLTSAVLGPVGVALGAVVGIWLSNKINSRIHEKEQAQLRSAASEKMQQIINDISLSVGAKIQEAVDNIRDNANASIDSDIAEKIQLKRKSLDELRNRLEQNMKEKEDTIAVFNNDISMIDMMLKKEGLLNNG